MRKEDTKESRIDTLNRAQEARKQDCLSRVEKAIERLQKIGAKINFPTIAKEANLSVSYLYKYPELKQRIAQIRSQQSSMPISPVAKPGSPSYAKIVSRLKERIHQLDEQNQELRRKNEALAGQVYRVHHLQEQVERQQQTIADLQVRIKEAQSQKSVDKVTPISSKKKAEISAAIKSELEALSIPLNTTLTKTIKSASEEIVLNAIEAFKEAMTSDNIKKPGAWLKSAIEDGWNKNEPRFCGSATGTTNEFSEWFELAKAQGVVQTRTETEDGLMIQDSTGQLMSWEAWVQRGWTLEYLRKRAKGR